LRAGLVLRLAGWFDFRAARLVNWGVYVYDGEVKGKCNKLRGATAGTRDFELGVSEIVWQSLKSTNDQRESRFLLPDAPANHLRVN
jgi:hypothetical protein